MSRLTGNLLQSAGKRFFFALDSSPGIVAPGVATLTLGGQVPIAVEPQTIFRTPTPAVLTLIGGSLGAPSTVIPASAAVSMGGLVPAKVTTRTIQPALPDAQENPPPDPVATLITIVTAIPAPAAVTLDTLTINITQGGNVGFISPGVGSISMGTQPFTLLLLAGGVDASVINLTGLAPSLVYGLTINPDVGLLTIPVILPLLDLPFRWVDDDPVPASPWITDAAA